MPDPRFDAFDRRRWQTGFGRDLSGSWCGTTSGPPRWPRRTARTRWPARARSSSATCTASSSTAPRASSPPRWSRRTSWRTRSARGPSTGRSSPGAEARARMHGRGGPAPRRSARGRRAGRVPRGHPPHSRCTRAAAGRRTRRRRWTGPSRSPRTSPATALTEYRALADADRQKAVDRYYPSGGFTRLMSVLPAADAVRTVQRRGAGRAAPGAALRGAHVGEGLGSDRTRRPWSARSPRTCRRRTSRGRR